MRFWRLETAPIVYNGNSPQKKNPNEPAVIRYKPETVIYKQGTAARNLILLYEGIVSLTRSTADGRVLGTEIIRVEFPNPTVLSEGFFRPDRHHPSTATSWTDCLIIELNERQVRQALLHNQDLILQLMASMADRIDHSGNRLVDQVFKTVRQRANEFLRTLPPNVRTPNNTVIGRMVGGSRELVSKAFNGKVLGIE